MGRRGRAPALIATGWLTLGLLGGVLETLVVGGGGPLGIRSGLPLAGVLWVPLTYAATALARRVPWDGTGRLRFVLLHGVAAVAASYVLNGAFFAIELLARTVPPEAVVPATLGAGTRWLHLHTASWAAVVGLVHVVDGRVGRSTGAPATEPTLHVHRGRGGLQVPWSEIEWIEADGDYARVHVGGRTHLVSTRMKELEHELSDPRFVRVHRSAIVNVGSVREIRHRSHGDFEAEMADGTVVRVSRTRRDALLASWKAGAMPM
jgi:DNA-binding LytR/AlgR family response regulator